MEEGFWLHIDVEVILVPLQADACGVFLEVRGEVLTHELCVYERELEANLYKISRCALHDSYAALMAAFELEVLVVLVVNVDEISLLEGARAGESFGCAFGHGVFLGSQ
jgi:hypothetical protein